MDKSLQTVDASANTIAYTCSYTQSRKQVNQQWSINSLDIVLGLVGGLAGIVWGLMALVFGPYEAFKLENSMISAVYPTAPDMHSDISNSSTPSST